MGKQKESGATTADKNKTYSGHEAYGELPEYQALITKFDIQVASRFGAGTPVDETSGFADPSTVLQQIVTSLLPHAGEDYPPVIYETDFVHVDHEWKPYRHILKGVPREREFLNQVGRFFDEFCFNHGFTLAGIEEPKSAIRSFSRVNIFTFGDEIRVDVRAGKLYTASPSGGWDLIYSELLLCRHEDFDTLSQIMNNSSHPPDRIFREEWQQACPTPSPVAIPLSETGEPRTFEVLVDRGNSPAEFIPLSSFKFRSEQSYATVLAAVKKFATASTISLEPDEVPALMFEGIEGRSTTDRYGYQSALRDHQARSGSSYRIIIPGLGSFEGWWGISQFDVCSHGNPACFNLSLFPQGPISFAKSETREERIDTDKIRQIQIPLCRVGSEVSEELALDEAIDLISRREAFPISPAESYWVDIPADASISLEEAYYRFVYGYPHVPGYANLEQLAKAVGLPLRVPDQVWPVFTRTRVDLFGPVQTQGGYLKPPTWNGIAEERREQVNDALLISTPDPRSAQRFFEAYIPFLTRAAQFHFFRLLIDGDLIASGDEPGKLSADDLKTVGKRLWQTRNIYVNALDNSLVQVTKPDGKMKVLFDNLIVRKNGNFKFSGEARAREFLRRKEQAEPGYKKNTNAEIARQMLDSGDFPRFDQLSLQTILSRVNPKRKKKT